MAGAFTVQGIATNTVEDSIDEGVTNLVYAMGNHYFGDGTSDAKASTLVEDALDEALEGAGQTLKFTIMNAVIFRVTDYALVKVIAGSSVIYGYIKAGRVVNTVKRKMESAVSGIPFVGNAVGGALTVSTSLAVGNQNERLAMSNMANNNLNNLTTVLSNERQTATMQVSSQRKQLLDTLGLNNEAKGFSDNKKIEAYHHKMKTGTWSLNPIDKKLFISVVPKEYIGIKFRWDTSFVKSLNTFTEYAKSTENKLVNVAQTNLDLMTSNNMSKVST